MIPQAFQLREPMINKTQTRHLLTLTFKKQNGFPKRKLRGATRFSSLARRSSVGSHPPRVPAPTEGSPTRARRCPPPQRSQREGRPRTEACPAGSPSRPLVGRAPSTTPSAARQPDAHPANTSPDLTTVSAASPRAAVPVLGSDAPPRQVGEPSLRSEGSGPRSRQ